MNPDLSGLWVALATPFTSDGDVDFDGLRRLVAHTVDGGVDVLLALGSTGEAATLEDGERDEVVIACLEASEGRPVIVGTGHNATPRAATMTRRAQELGAAGALVVSPYYNKPEPGGLERHYREVAATAPDFPIIVYNVPGRTGSNVSPSTLARLWEQPPIVAVKESSGNLAQIAEIARGLPEDKILLSGDDNMVLGSIAVGASGLVSVLGNLLPGEMKQLVEASRAGELEQARAIFHRLLPVMDALFVESNPIPVKAGLKMLGIAGDRVRLPLTEASASTRERLGDALEEAGVEGAG